MGRGKHEGDKARKRLVDALQALLRDSILLLDAQIEKSVSETTKLKAEWAGQRSAAQKEHLRLERQHALLLAKIHELKRHLPSSYYNGDVANKRALAAVDTELGEGGARGNAREQELSQIVQMLRDRSGANIVILAGAENVVRDLQVSDVHWRDALEYASEMAQCVVEEDSSGVLKVTQPPRVNFDFPDADITEIITTIGKVAGANIIISPDVQGTLTVRLNNVPWRDALEEVAKTRGYVVVQERRDILRVVDPASLAESALENMRLRPLTATATEPVGINPPSN